MSNQIDLGESNKSPESFSSSKLYEPKTGRIIKKKPKPVVRNKVKFKEAVWDSPKTEPRFGIFESETQKHFRIEKFWKEEVNNFYRKEVSENEKQALKNFISETPPSLKEIARGQCEAAKIPFDELYRYLALVYEVSTPDTTLVSIENGAARYMGVIDREKNLVKAVEVTGEEMKILIDRAAFMRDLRARQEQYNSEHGKSEAFLSEMSSEIAFLIKKQQEHKSKLVGQLKSLYATACKAPPPQKELLVEDQYLTFLQFKNLADSLTDREIDYFNYYQDKDNFETVGEKAPERKQITDRREFEDYLRRKKKQRKGKNTLKSSCSCCLSNYYEPYNPILSCADCQTRYHQFCYSGATENACQVCTSKKVTSRTKIDECMLCLNRGFFMQLPSKQHLEIPNVHVFCMLINGFWKYRNKELEFIKPAPLAEEAEQFCFRCEGNLFLQKCKSCHTSAHPSCAYLEGWEITLIRKPDSTFSVQLGEPRSTLEMSCCHVDKASNEKRRKFVLNYKKCVFKWE